MLDESAGESAPLRSKANPFQDVPQDKRASVVVQGFLKRKLHADIDGKRSKCDKKTFHYLVGKKYDNEMLWRYLKLL